MTLTIRKTPSDNLLVLIKAAANNLMGFADLWLSIKKLGGEEGFTETELQDMIRPLLKPQLNKDQIYYLFHSDEKKEQSRQSYHRNIPTVAPNKPIVQNPISTQPPKDQNEETPKDEPTKEELEEINKSLETPSESEEVKQLFKTLSERHDGTHTFWYDSYGIDLFKNRELSQLKNSGVKSFKRLYFEV